ncbi:MAG: hypothetical protein QM644_18480 [Mobilitalea sp.]
MPIINRTNQRPRIRPNQIAFTASQIWTVPTGIKRIDVFLVGGGGGPGGSHCYFYWGEGAEYRGVIYGGGSGGCGYTKTIKNVSVTPGQQIPVIVGTGGTAGLYFQVQGGVGSGGLYSVGTAPSADSATNGSDGGASSFGSYSVLGGKGGYKFNYAGNNHGIGGAGGSGGGAGQLFNLYRTYGGQDQYTYNYGIGDFGTDGGNGQTVYYVSGGAGQGSTTRAFGEAGNTLYASNGVTGANTGMGGISSGQGTANGAAGIVLVRWPQQ